MKSKLVIPRIHGAEAIQFDGTFDDAEWIARQLNGRSIPATVVVNSDGLDEIELEHKGHMETITQGDYVLLFVGGGFSVLDPQQFHHRYTTSHDYNLTEMMTWIDKDYEAVVNEITEKHMQPEQHKFPQMFYLRVERTYSPNWMPGSITQVFSFQAPIRPAWGPQRYENIVRDKIKAGSRDAVVVSFSRWPRPALEKVPMLLPFKSHEEDVYAEGFRITQARPESVTYSSAITQFIMTIRDWWS